MSKSLAALLDQLDKSKSRFGERKDKSIVAALARLSRRRFTDAENLIRYHELLLFLRAYPQSAWILQIVEKQLASFGERVEWFESTGVDMSALERPEVSGIAGTAVTDTFSYYIVRWLLNRHVRGPHAGSPRGVGANQIGLDWDWFEDQNRLAETWPRFMPLLEEDAFVEANVPYQDWLRSASGRRGRELPWLLQRFEALPLSQREKAELYDSQQLYVRWRPSYRASRTGMRLPVRRVFYHRAPLIQRRDLSFRDELAKPSPPINRLSLKQGQRILDLARETSTIRYRELYGFTHGDERHVLQVNIGRGVELFIVGVPPGRRLPLRVYHAAMIFKNGIPVGYFEGISLFERMESGFNVYYSFREGETAWIYARTLNVFRRLLGVTTFSIDPYQVGHENEEGIESGAFWFYRKLGFCPTRPELLSLTLREEQKLAAGKSYRTPAVTLRKLAAGPMIFELEDARAGDWNRFQVRNIGLAVQRRVSERYRGQAERMREASVKAIARVLGIDGRFLNENELATFRDVAVVLMLIPDFDQWSAEEKQGVVRIIKAKASRNEARYLRLMHKEPRLRKAFIKIGSTPAGLR